MGAGMGDSNIGEIGDLRLRMARLDTFDTRSFCELFNSLYARKVDENYYRWQFFATPFPSGLAVATAADGKWIGCYGFHVVPSSGGCSPVAWMLDIMVAPEFQRRGVFGRLADFAATAAAAEYKPVALCVMANAKADAAHARQPGWKRVMEISTFERPTSDAPELSGKFECRYEERIDLGVLSKIGAGFPAGLVSQVRSESYLRWRFAENAWYRYSMIVASEGQIDTAALVLKIFRDPQSGVSSGDIVDVIWTREDPAALRDLLYAALQHFKKNEVATAATWLQTNTVLDRAGKELGFAKINHIRYCNCRILDSRLARLGSASSWFFTMSAAEIY
jgi:GNAT superfamily N-acetyltransferase